MCKRKFNFGSGSCVILSVVVIVTMLPLISCEAALPFALVGNWLYESGNNADIQKMELYKDGTGVCDGGTVSWKVEDKRFVILSPSKGYAYDYKVSGSKLILINDGKDSVTYVTRAERERQMTEVISIKDSRDGKTYKAKKIGYQTWMAENLNYVTGNSWCYDDDNSNCAKYGRLYDWNTAMKACPEGWHLPSNKEWDNLSQTVGGLKVVDDDDGTFDYTGAGAQLKSTSGWNNNGNGTDKFGFSALPGGGRYLFSDFGSVGKLGLWWSATEQNARQARYRSMGNDNSNVDDDWVVKSNGQSVRCVQDSKEELAALGKAKTDASSSKGTTDNRLNGVWVYVKMELRLNNGNFEFLMDDNLLSNGTYTTDKGEITFKATHVSGRMMNVLLEFSMFESRLYTINELISTIKTVAPKAATSDAEAKKYAQSLIEGLQPPQSSYSVDGNTLIFTEKGNENKGGTKFTKK